MNSFEGHSVLKANSPSSPPPTPQPVLAPTTYLESQYPQSFFCLWAPFGDCSSFQRCSVSPQSWGYSFLLMLGSGVVCSLLFRTTWRSRVCELSFRTKRNRKLEPHTISCYNPNMGSYMDRKPFKGYTS